MLWPVLYACPILNEQMNQLTDTQTKNSNFILANLWDRSRVTCVPNLVKISWKLSKLSYFSTFQWTNEPTNRHTNINSNFILANLWERSRVTCVPILVKISWKLSKLSHFSTFQWTNEPTDGHTNKKFKFHFSQSVR